MFNSTKYIITAFFSFQIAGIFLNGRSDMFFYEYLSDICGDSLEPFLFSYERMLYRWKKLATLI